MTLSVPQISLLLALLSLAAWSDVRARRIPNALVAVGLAGGLVAGFAQDGWSGLSAALLGAAAGFVCFFPLYVMRAMGAGDVKLMSAAGAFLGAPLALSAALFSLGAGVTLGIVLAVRTRALRRVAANTGNLLSLWVTSGGVRQAEWLTLDSPDSVKVPYGVAIAFGCAIAAFFPQLSVL